MIVIAENGVVQDIEKKDQRLNRVKREKGTATCDRGTFDRQENNHKEFENSRNNRIYPQ